MVGEILSKSLHKKNCYHLQYWVLYSKILILFKEKRANYRNIKKKNHPPFMCPSGITLSSRKPPPGWLH